MATDALVQTGTEVGLPDQACAPWKTPTLSGRGQDSLAYIKVPCEKLVQEWLRETTTTRDGRPPNVLLSPLTTYINFVPGKSDLLPLSLP